MKEKYKLAKNQGLNWQALVIEDLQSYIKLEVRNRVIDGWKFDRIWKHIDEYIKQEIAGFENEDLKKKTYSSMLLLAKRVYYILYGTLFGIGIVALNAMQDISKGTATSEQYKIVERSMSLKGVYKHAVPLDMYSKDYMNLVQKQIDYMARMEAKEYYDARVNMRNIAEMTVRYDNHVKEIQELQEQGVKLVWIEPHANCSKRCEPWQGKLYSLDGTYGSTDDGVSYEPLTNATDVYEVTKSGRVYKNGCISGFNCRHKLIPYKQGVKPIEIPAKEVARQRKINDTQRAMEREVRYWREIALQNRGINAKMYVEARERAKRANSRYIQYSRENDVPYYPSRTKILDNE